MDGYGYKVVSTTGRTIFSGDYTACTQYMGECGGHQFGWRVVLA